MTVINLELNELNFDYIQKYVDSGELPGFASLLSRFTLRKTVAETSYELLEPWIQWPTVYTGLTFAEHQIFRLGDSVNHSHEQIFELLEKETGQPVVAVSPMNAVNRVSEKSVFIPDPWTSTKVTGPKSCRVLFGIVKRLVNANSHGLAIRATDFIMLPLSLISNLSLSLVWPIVLTVKLALTKKWARPLVLDLLLASLFICQVKKRSTGYGSLFLNAGAHIQHHYLFSSEQYSGDARNPTWFVDEQDDPLLAVYKVYDTILSNIFYKFADATIFVSTGLSQRPNLKTVHYYRPKDHQGLIEKLVQSPTYFEVEERMSRDFLVVCADVASGAHIGSQLASLKLSNGEALFRIDVRGESIFCQVAYNGAPSSALYFDLSDEQVMFHDHFSHVTVENGIHHKEGYIIRSDLKSGDADASSLPLSSLFEEIREACRAPAT